MSTANCFLPWCILFSMSWKIIVQV